jgi:DNA polymerase-3 subunit gamma/tau
VSEVLYRKWRPQSFAEVVGQDPVTRTLRNSVASGRLAHAYLFCGPRGTGKTSLGRLLAKAANCAAPAEGEPCNACPSCVAFNEGRAMDFVEQDAASHNSVDDIRQLRENVVLTPMSGSRKVYLLDEVHMLSKGAHNALLKTLEEPPPHIIFVLATTEPHKVEPTVISRCQRFDLKRISAAAAAARLAVICEKEGFALDAASLAEIARSASGSLRDAINALEQVVTYYGRSPTFEQVQEALGLRADARSGRLAALVLDGDLTGALKLIAAVRDDGVDMRQFNKQLVAYLRGLLLARAGAHEALDLPAELAADVKTESAKRERGDIIRALRAFGRIEFRDDPQSSLPIELALVEFISDREAKAPAAPAQPRPAEPAPEPAAQEPAPEPQPEPRFSIPVAETDDVASTVARAALGDPAGAPAEPPAEAAPAPEAARTTASTAPGGDLLTRVYQMCRESDKTLAAILNGSCEVKAVEGDSVTLAFYHTFHLERAESEPNAGKIRGLFAQALGRPVKIAYEHAPRERPSGPVKGGHLVQAARELGARPVVPEKGGSDV